MGTKRSKGGCWTCRRRHQKCDETKPACWNCQLRGVECGGYGIKLTDHTSSHNKNGQLTFRVARDSPTAETPDENASSGIEVAVQHRKRRNSWLNESYGNITSPQVAVANKRAPLLRQHEDEDDQLVVPGAANATESAVRERVGDSALRSFEPEAPPLPQLLHYHDVEFPFQAGFGQLDPTTISLNGGQVVQASQEEILHGQYIAHSSSPSPNSSSMVDQTLLSYLTQLPIETEVVCPAERNDALEINGQEQVVNDDLLRFMNNPVLQPPPNDPFEQHLFRHYIHNLSLHLYPMKPDRSPYRLVYGHLATKFEPLRNAILYASAMHLSKLGQLPRFAISPYRTVMRNSFRIAVQNEEAAWGLAATVLLSIVFDVIDTGLDVWSSKLVGCRRLLQLGLAKQENDIDSSRGCILVQYNWAAMMSRVLMRGILPSARLEEMKYINIASFDGQNAQSNMLSQCQAHWWGNLPDYTMHLFLREATELATSIDKLKEEQETSNTNKILQIMPHVSDLVTRVQTWTPDLSSVDLEFADTVQYFNEVWKHGVLCYIYHEIYCLPPLHELMQGCVMSAVESLSKFSWLQACLFPVFIMAVHAKTQKARDAIERSLTDMHTALAFNAPLSVIFVLKTIWEQLDADHTNTVVWRDVVREMELELNVLL